MIDPTKITRFDRTIEELEELLLFCVCAAGKNARHQAARLDDFFGLGAAHPFVHIRALHAVGKLRAELQRARLGKYSLLYASFRTLAEEPPINLRTCEWDALTRYPGIGIKTAKFFILHSRPGQRMAVLDTYILQQLQREFPRAKVPRTSPGHPEVYRFWETLWLGLCAEQGITDFAAYDLAVWNAKGKAA